MTDLPRQVYSRARRLGRPLARAREQQRRADALAAQLDELEARLQLEVAARQQADQARDTIAVQRDEIRAQLNRLLTDRDDVETDDAEETTGAELRSQAIERIEAMVRDGLGHIPSELAGQRGLFAAFNPSGTRPPIYWCFNGWAEAVILARRLGSDQPLYAMRSFHRLVDDRWRKVLHTESLSVLYAEQVLEIHAGGPMVVGGNCQAGSIAEGVAHRIVAERGATPVLVTVDHDPRYAYPGHVVLGFGTDSERYNPFLSGGDPIPAWQRLHRATSWTVIPGQHGRYFLKPALHHLVALIEAVTMPLADGSEIPPGPIELDPVEDRSP
jgi:hypothetical protein